MKKSKSLLLGLSAALAAQLAFAHAELSSSVPADGAVLDAAPKEVTLHFSEAVRLTAITLTGAEGPARHIEPLPKESSADFTLALPALAHGHYSIEWRVLSEDTHVMEGRLSFDVTAGETNPQHSGHATH